MYGALESVTMYGTLEIIVTLLLLLLTQFQCYLLTLCSSALGM